MRAIGPEGDPNGCPVDMGSYPVVARRLHGGLPLRRGGQLQQSELLTGDEGRSREQR